MLGSNIISSKRDSITYSSYMLESVVSTLEAICGEKPFYQGDDSRGLSCEGVVGMISMVGAVHWTMAVCLPRSVVESITRKFAGFEIPYTSPDMGDVVGELANVIGGDVIARLDSIGVTAELSLPSIGRGNDMEILLPDSIDVESMQFESSDGIFWVVLASDATN